MDNDLPWKQYMRRIPQWDESFRESLKRLNGEGAPKWSAFVGDRRGPDDERFVDAFALTLAGSETRSPTLETLSPWIRQRMKDTLWFRKNLSLRDLSDLPNLPTMSRDDLAFSLAEIIPETADLTGLVINPTSGTTGRPLSCPNHPRAIGCYDAFLERILDLWGIAWDLTPGKTAAVQVCYQAETLTYATTHARHHGAGFAKVNLHPDVWPLSQAQPWFDAVGPQILTGDPWSFQQMTRLGLRVRPLALISTSLKMPSPLRLELEEGYGCPVIDLYSLNETGPLGVTLPGQPEAFVALAPDVVLEADAASGELLVTGGRNPYLPLFRYRTGDVVEFLPSATGRTRFRLSRSRELVEWIKADGNPTQPLEVARILRAYPEVLSHRLSVEGPESLTLTVRAPDLSASVAQELKDRLASFWEGDLVAARSQRTVAHAVPTGRVQVRVLQE